MELRDADGPRLLTVGVYFVIASLLLYIGFAIGNLVPAPPEESRLAQAMFPLLFLLAALLLTFRIAWILRRPESSASKRRGLWLAVPLSIAGVFLGLVLVSVAVWREHWLELVEGLVGLK